MVNMIYPVVVFRERDKMIYGIPNEKQLTTTTREGLKRKGSLKDTIIDSEGNIYESNGAKEIGWANPFWGFNPFIKGRLIRIDILFKPETSCISLEDFKKLICEKIDSFPEAWEAGGGVEAVKDYIGESKSYKEVIEKLF